MKADMILIEETTKGSAPKPYVTTVSVINGEVRLGCDCMGWTRYKNRTRSCKHTDDLVAKHGLTIRAGSGKNGDEFQIVTNLDTSGNRISTTVKPAAKPAAKPAPPVLTKFAKPRAAAPTAQNRVPAAASKPVVDAYGIRIIDLPDDTGLDPYVEPMLAEKMPGLTDHKVATVLAAIPRFKASEWAMEEKFDGERITVARLAGGALKAWSRPQKGNDAIVREIPDYIANVFDALPPALTFTIDGEEYVPGGYSSDVRNLANAGKKVWVMFDITRLLGQDTTKCPWTERREYLEELFSRPALSGSSSVQLSQVFDPSAAKVQEIFARKGEGAILKRRTSKYYPGGRSADHWIKVKGLETGLFEVTGFKKGKLGPHATVLLKNPQDGSTTKVKTLNNVWLKKFEQDHKRYIGKMLWIEYQFRTPDGNYRHPMFDRFADE